MLVLTLTGKPIIAETVNFVTFDLVPYALSDDPDGRLGLFVDINKAIAIRAGVTFTDTVLPIARALKNLERGLSDCAVFVLTPWSKVEFTPVAEVLNRFDVIIVPRTGLSTSRIEDLHGQRLALPRGSFRDLPISTDPDIQQVLTNGYKQSVRLLKAGRVDAIIGSELSILFYFSIEKMTPNDIGDAFTFERNQLWLQCAKGHLSEETITKLQQTTTSLRMEGVFDKLIKQYIAADLR